MGSHTGEVYYPTAYNVVDTFPIVQPAQGHALHPYPHAYSNASHQMAPSPSRHQRRDIYGGMHENEAAAPQAGQVRLFPITPGVISQTCLFQPHPQT
ncbi:hypothetical protein PISMIDRAFT_678000 [Pisolithus microcarpus 441]|uniref:Uncharacterized protein n=1 Tax=Pisolithus microcarpus 441 TaxID=765257 RepID=A0A0C9ZFA9_9AGAM|nr:hypothetical protein PISMIDRAFT_678000 [Pisolithus microcarpus 441]